MSHLARGGFWPRVILSGWNFTVDHGSQEDDVLGHGTAEAAGDEVSIDPGIGILLLALFRGAK